MVSVLAFPKGFDAVGLMLAPDSGVSQMVSGFATKRIGWCMIVQSGC